MQQAPGPATRRMSHMPSLATGRCLLCIATVALWLAPETVGFLAPSCQAPVCLRPRPARCPVLRHLMTDVPIESIVEAPWQLSQDHPAATNEKVTGIFKYLQENPLTVGGEPMDYEPLQVMAKRTQRRFVSSPAFELRPEDLPGGKSDEERLKLLETTGQSAGDLAAATCALLQLACGGLDECHNRITPMSWPDGTLFGGPPIYNSDAQEDATFLHCLVHIREGKFPGEFGTGWNNAAFWSGQTGMDHPVFVHIPEAALAASCKYPHLQAEIEREVQQGWALGAFVRRCSASVADGQDTGYCDVLLNAVFRLLFEHMWAKLPS